MHTTREQRQAMAEYIEAHTAGQATFPAALILALIADAERAEGPEPLAWESTTTAYTRFITDSRYRKLRPSFQRWYRPICQKCGPSAAINEASGSEVPK